MSTKKGLGTSLLRKYTKKSFGEIVTEGEIKLVTWCYRSRIKLMSTMLQE
jgi:hypothetical protein